MGLAARLELYKQVEARRNRPLIVYVTSTRVNGNGRIAADSVPEILDQLQCLPKGTKEIDLLIVSDGGDPTVAYRIVSLIRARAERFSALVPQAAYSAATLIVLGADEVVMHPNGNLGPTDPQIMVPRRSGKDGATEVLGFGSEDLMAFLRFAREQVGLKEPEHMLEVFSKFCDEVTTLGVGVSARSAMLSLTLGEKLLLLHMKGEGEQEKAKAISAKLTKDYFHHGYPVNRSEARQIGLKVAEPDEELEDLMWRIWSDLSDELRLREPHNPLRVLADNAACQPLFAAVPVIQMPANLPPALAQQVHQQVLAQVAVASVPPAPFELIHAVVESTRHASRFVTSGLVVGTKTADHQIRMSTLNVRQQWTNVDAEAKAAELPPEAIAAAVAEAVAGAPAPAAPPPQGAPAPAPVVAAARQVPAEAPKAVKKRKPGAKSTRG